MFLLAPVEFGLVGFDMVVMVVVFGFCCCFDFVILSWWVFAIWGRLECGFGVVFCVWFDCARWIVFLVVCDLGFVVGGGWFPGLFGSLVL